MFSPFKKGNQYFIKTITFYYIGTYKSQRGGFVLFDNLKWLENVPDWEDFWKSRPHLPPSMKAHEMPGSWINQSAIVDVTEWQSTTH